MTETTAESTTVRRPVPDDRWSARDITLMTAAIAALVSVVCLSFGGHLRASVIYVLQSGGYLSISLAVLVVLVTFAWTQRTRRYGRPDRPWGTWKTVTSWALGLACAATFAAGMWFSPGGPPYKALYAKRVETVTTPLPAFEERPAWRLADNVLRANTDNLDSADARYLARKYDARYIAEQGDDRYSMLVDDPSEFGSYGSTSGSLIGVAEWRPAAAGQEVVTCRFDKGAVRSLNGWFEKNLPRRIHNQPGASDLVFDVGNAYGTCEHGKAKLYWPATDRTGFPVATDVFGALVIVDHTGAITFDRDVEAGEHPGPVYPRSLAETQRRSIDKHLPADGPAGFGTDPELDPNTGDPTEMELVVASGGGGAYVTPLQEDGGSSRIEAVSVIDSGQATAGRTNTLTVYKLHRRRLSGVDVSQAIKDSIEQLPAPETQVMEVAPVDGNWLATLGAGTADAYQVSVAADGDLCFRHSDPETDPGCAAPGE